MGLERGFRTCKSFKKYGCKIGGPHPFLSCEPPSEFVGDPMRMHFGTCSVAANGT